METTNTNTENRISLGDTVSGTYHGTRFTGIVCSLSGYSMGIDLPEGWTHNGRSYDSIARSHYDFATVSLVSKGQNVKTHESLGTTYLDR